MWPRFSDQDKFTNRLFVEDWGSADVVLVQIGHRLLKIYAPGTLCPRSIGFGP